MSTAPSARARHADSRIWVGSLLTALAAAAFSVACAVTLPLQIDEYFTRNLALDPSLAAMFASLRDGADGSFPAHPTFAWLWMRVMPDADLSLRATSSLFVVALAAYLVLRLARYCPWPIAAAAVFVVLIDDRVVIYLQSGRFYGLLVFAFAWLFWSTWDLSRAAAPSASARTAVVLAGTLTALSHPLGVLHVALLVGLHVLLAVACGTLRWRDLACYLPAALAFAVWMAINDGQREINMVFGGRAHFPFGNVLWDYVVQASLPYTAALAAAALVLGRSGEQWFAQRRRGEGAILSDQVLLLAYAFATGLGISTIVLALDVFDIVPVLMSRAFRYVLASVVAQIVLIALLLDRLRRLLTRIVPQRLAPLSMLALSGAVLLAVSVVATRDLARNAGARALSEHALASLLEMARPQNLDIVFDVRPFVAPGAFFAAMRAPQQAVYFVLTDDYPVRELHLRSARNYPNPRPLSPEELSRKPRPYVLVKDNLPFHIVPADPAPTRGDDDATAHDTPTDRPVPASGPEDRAARR